MSIFHPHFSDPETMLSIPLAIWWRDTHWLVLRELQAHKYRKGIFGSSLSGNLLIYPPGNLIMESEMNGRKPKSNGDKSRSSNGKSLPFRWINVPLTDQDIDILEGEEIGLEQLALNLIQLVGSGIGVSVKYDNAGKSYVVSLYGSDQLNDRQPCGISGASPNLRDAILVSLYRFGVKLSGSFDGQANPDSVLQPRRFR